MCKFHFFKKRRSINWDLSLGDNFAHSQIFCKINGHFYFPRMPWLQHPSGRIMCVWGGEVTKCIQKFCKMDLFFWGERRGRSNINLCFEASSTQSLIFASPHPVLPNKTRLHYSFFQATPNYHRYLQIFPAQVWFVYHHLIARSAKSDDVFKWWIWDWYGWFLFEWIWNQTFATPAWQTFWGFKANNIIDFRTEDWLIDYMPSFLISSNHHRCVFSRCPYPTRKG